MKDALLDTYTNIDTHELRDLVIITINYAIRQYRLGKKQFAEEVFTWYKFGIEKGPLTQDNFISPFTYRNAATVALLFDRIDWAEHFTRSYQSYLPQSYRENMFGFNMGRIAYQKGDYNMARYYLWTLEFDDTILTLAVRTPLLKIYFLIGEYSVLDATTDAFRAYLIRKKIAKSHTQSYMRFAQYIRALSRWKQYIPDKMEGQRLKLLNKIRADDSFIEKNGLYNNWSTHQRNVGGTLPMVI